MFKRLFWLTAGLLVGSSGSFWVQRKVRERVARYRPERLAADAGGAVRDLGHDLRAAALDGRAAMRRRELELRTGYSPPPGDGHTGRRRVRGR